jgi:predicted nucleic acid-binding protein
VARRQNPQRHASRPQVAPRRAILKEEQQRILRDVLIARTTKRANVAIVTEDVSDFVRIQRYCDVRILRPEDYFPS